MGRPALGEEARIEVTVTDEMLVDLGGRQIHPVYATAWMVRHMEEAGRALIERHLDLGEDATGYSISVTHERPAHPGETLNVTATVTDVNERSCTTRLETVGPVGPVGTGTLVQRYIRADWLDEGGTDVT